jgi:hypothetical protein
MIRSLWELYRIPSKLTFMQKLRFVYLIMLLLTPRDVETVPLYVPMIEEEDTLEMTEERVADLMEGVKGLSTF